MPGQLLRVDVGDLTFDVRADGPEDGRPVLLLHGFPQTSRSWAAVTPLLTRAGRTVRAPLDREMVRFFADARRGDESALRSVRAAAEPLGRTIASLHNTLNLERVVVGGTVGDTVELMRPEIEGYVGRYTSGTAKRQVQLVLPAFGNDSPLLGAAEIAFERLLADPH